MISLPPKKAAAEDILAQMQALRQDDANWRAGKTWSLVFHAGDDVSDLLQKAYTMFFAETA